MSVMTVSGIARLMGVTNQSVWKWVKEDKVPYHRRPTGRIYFNEKDISIILGHEDSRDDEIWAYYARSSSGDKGMINNQFNELSGNYHEPVYMISDNASGLNENRKGINRLLRLADNKQITDIAITHKDRLTRFGYTYLKGLFTSKGVTIHILHENKNSSKEQELLDDFMRLLSSYAGKYYHLRGTQAQERLLGKAKETIHE